jgi:hypothetical protein
MTVSAAGVYRTVDTSSASELYTVIAGIGRVGSNTAPGGSLRASGKVGWAFFRPPGVLGKRLCRASIFADIGLMGVDMAYGLGPSIHSTLMIFSPSAFTRTWSRRRPTESKRSTWPSTLPTATTLLPSTPASMGPCFCFDAAFAVCGDGLAPKTDRDVTGACACQVRRILPPASKSISLHLPSAPTLIARVRKPGRNAAPVIVTLLLPTIVFSEASGGSDRFLMLVTRWRFEKCEISPAWPLLAGRELLPTRAAPLRANFVAS